MQSEIDNTYTTSEIKVATSPLQVADIFCGAGGLSAGFKDASATWSEHGERFEIVYGVDHDQDAINTFRAFHFPDVEEKRLEKIAPCRDIKDVKVDDIKDAAGPGKQIDVLIGGPNCQGVSAAGLRNPEDDRNDMLPAFIRLVDELRPRWFVMENVPGLTHANNRALLSEIFKQLETIDGYKVAGDVLLAANYGVPQFRYRLFIVGTNTGSPIRFPLPTHVPCSIDKVQELPKGISAYATVRDEIHDLAQYTPEAYDEHALPNGLIQSNPSSPSNHYCVELSSLNKKRITEILPGQDWRYMPVRLLPERYFATRASDQKGAYGRLLWDWLAYTITNESYNVTAGPFTHPEQDRPLSVREVARLQSFSDKHVFCGTVASQYRQVGNAVPPKLARAVAEAIIFCHYRKEDAQNWGKAGRINYEVIRQSIEGEAKFPTMTPRHVHPSFGFRHGEQGGGNRQRFKQVQEPQDSAWDSSRRTDLREEDTRLLRKLSEQPSNYRAAKRAKAIIEFIDGVKKEDIVKAANVSEASVKKWVDGYFEKGLDGWRAYHSTPERILGQDPTLINKIAAATASVRQVMPIPSANGGENWKTPKRLYMNDDLLKLIDRFGNCSVKRLIEETEKALRAGIGTVYVGDLLAICGVVLKEDISTSSDRRNPSASV